MVYPNVCVNNELVLYVSTMLLGDDVHVCTGNIATSSTVLQGDDILMQKYLD